MLVARQTTPQGQVETRMFQMMGDGGIDAQRFAQEDSSDG